MIRLDEDGGLFTLTLDRPGKRITGAGPVFCGGADLAEVPRGLDTDPLWEVLSGRIAELPIPTLAALNGSVVGGGFGMVLACDIRLATPGVQLIGVEDGSPLARDKTAPSCGAASLPGGSAYAP